MSSSASGLGALEIAAIVLIALILLVCVGGTSSSVLVFVVVPHRHSFSPSLPSASIPKVLIWCLLSRRRKSAQQRDAGPPDAGLDYMYRCDESLESVFWFEFDGNVFSGCSLFCSPGYDPDTPTTGVVAVQVRFVLLGDVIDLSPSDARRR